MKEIYDPIRRVWVTATPEELIRQIWIQRMIADLNFPKQLLVVEKELKTLPHLMNEQIDLPSRRIDLLSFIQKDETLYPLLLIECKQGALTDQALNQAIAYNHYVQASYIAVVNRTQIRFCYHFTDHKGYEIKILPTYSQLVEGFNG